MNVFGIGSVNMYAKSLKLEASWQMKKDSGDYTAHIQSLDQWLGSSSIGGQETKEQTCKKVQSIQLKLYSGKKLSSQEMEYLRKNDPQAYEKAKSIAAERKAYEEKLKNCKTKEEVERAKLSSLSKSFAIVNAVESNPNIPKGKKMEIMLEELAKTKVIQEATRKFVESGAYAELPTEAELREEETAEAAEREDQVAQEAQETKEPQEPDQDTDKKESSASQTTEAGESGTTDKTSEARHASGQKASHTKAREAYKKAAFAGLTADMDFQSAKRRQFSKSI